MAEFKKINRASVVQTVIDRLTESLIRGDLKPGDKIPTELELSEQMGIARNTVREAVKILVYMGVLEIKRPDGTFVAEGFSENLVDPMIYGIILNRNNEMDLNELRATMEAGVLNLSMQKCTPEDLSGLREKLCELKAAIYESPVSLDRVFDCDNEFHGEIARMCDNSMVSKINSMVMMLTWNTRYESVGRMLEEKRFDELYEAHEEIYRMLVLHQTENLYKSVMTTYFLEIA